MPRATKHTSDEKKYEIQLRLWVPLEKDIDDLIKLIGQPRKYMKRREFLESLSQATYVYFYDAAIHTRLPTEKSVILSLKHINNLAKHLIAACKNVDPLTREYLNKAKTFYPSALRDFLVSNCKTIKSLELSAKPHRRRLKHFENLVMSLRVVFDSHAAKSAKPWREFVLEVCTRADIPHPEKIR